MADQVEVSTDVAFSFSSRPVLEELLASLFAYATRPQRSPPSTSASRAARTSGPGGHSLPSRPRPQAIGAVDVAGGSVLVTSRRAVDHPDEAVRIALYSPATAIPRSVALSLCAGRPGGSASTACSGGREVTLKYCCSRGQVE